MSKRFLNCYVVAQLKLFEYYYYYFIYNYQTESIFLNNKQYLLNYG